MKHKIDVLRLEPYLEINKVDCILIGCAISNEIERLEKENQRMIVTNKYIGSKKINNIAVINHLKIYLEQLEKLKYYYEKCEELEK